MKLSQKNAKSLNFEKQSFLEEIKTVKTDLKVYETSAKSFKHCQLKLDSALKFQQDILKVLKKEASKTLYSSILHMIQKFQSNILPRNTKKPLNFEDLNNSKMSMNSDKNTTKSKTKRSLSLSNKSGKSKSNAPQVNTSMFCVHKRPSSPLIKCQKMITTCTENSSHKKKSSITKSPYRSTTTPKLSAKKSQCLEPAWNNEKLFDIQNILNSANNEEIGRNSHSRSKSKENCYEKKKTDERKKIERYFLFL